MLKNIYLVCGKSGSGKTTLVDKLREKYGYEVLQSYTTRKPRHKNDDDHIYSDLSTYMKYKTNKEIAADSVVENNMYWATFEQIENSDLYVINKEGIEHMKSLYSGDKKYFIIYIDVDFDECIRRMRLRGDSSKKIEKRVIDDCKNMTDTEKFADFIVDGTRNMEEVVSTVKNIIDKCEEV